MKDYDTLDSFDRDVHAMLHQGNPSPNIAADPTGASDCTNRQLTSDEVGEAGLGGARGEMIAVRRAALADDFAARAALDRIRVTSMIRLRRDVLRHVSVAGRGS